MLAQPAELGARAVELRAEPLGLRLARGERALERRHLVREDLLPRGGVLVLGRRSRLLRPRREPRLQRLELARVRLVDRLGGVDLLARRREHLALEAELLARRAQQLVALRQAHRHAPLLEPLRLAVGVAPLGELLVRLHLFFERRTLPCLLTHLLLEEVEPVLRLLVEDDHGDLGVRWRVIWTNAPGLFLTFWPRRFVFFVFCPGPRQIVEISSTR